MEAPTRPLDEGEAGAVWRSSRLQSLSSDLAALDLDPSQACELQAMLQRMQEETAALDALWEAQRDPGYTRRWWQDGELDQDRADRCNDEGAAALKIGRHGPAFQAFTEAIRLWPSAAAYHSNRAAAALKLGRADVAAQDARDALALDPGSTRAALRLGKACMALQELDDAAEAFQAALSSAGSQERGSAAAARRGLAAAAAAARERAVGQGEARRAAAAGARPGIPLGAQDPETSAAALEAARHAVAFDPGAHGPQAALAEACIACGRWADAAAAVEAMLPGADASYLGAQAAWRGGDLTHALRLLEGPEGQPPPAPPKCVQLHAFLLPLAEALAAADEAQADGVAEEVVEACDSCLASLGAAWAPGLRAELHARRGGAHAARGRPVAALQDAEVGLALEPGHGPCLVLHARTLSTLGRHTQAFLAWRLASRLAPGAAPDLEARCAEAAARAAGQQARASVGGGGSVPGGAALPPALQPALAALGLDGGDQALTQASLRAAYRRQAAAWHPDKWAARGEQGAAAAGERFKVVRAAYEQLLDCLA